MIGKHLEEGRLPKNLSLGDAVQSTRDISRDPTGAWIVRLDQWHINTVEPQQLVDRVGRVLQQVLGSALSPSCGAWSNVIAIMPPCL